MFHETLCVLAFKVNGKTLTCCTCNADEDCPQTRIRHGVMKYDPKSLLDSADSADVERVTNLDRVLYAVAKARLQWDIKYIRRHYDEAFLCDN